MHEARPRVTRWLGLFTFLTNQINVSGWVDYETCELRQQTRHVVCSINIWRWPSLFEHAGRLALMDRVPCRCLLDCEINAMIQWWPNAHIIISSSGRIAQLHDCNVCSCLTRSTLQWLSGRHCTQRMNSLLLKFVHSKATMRFDKQPAPLQLYLTLLPQCRCLVCSPYRLALVSFSRFVYFMGRFLCTKSYRNALSLLNLLAVFFLLFELFNVHVRSCLIWGLSSECIGSQSRNLPSSRLRITPWTTSTPRPWVCRLFFAFNGRIGDTCVSR